MKNYDTTARITLLEETRDNAPSELLYAASPNPAIGSRVLFPLRKCPLNLVYKSRQAFKSIEDSSGIVSAYRSPLLTDHEWDTFLEGTPFGQYQQSSLWARYKQSEGWANHRVILTQANEIIGGFQILWKRKYGMRLGYVSKGPILAGSFERLNSVIGNLLSQESRRLKLAALICQEPDNAANLQHTLGPLGFMESNPMQLIEATGVFDVASGIDDLRSRMSRSSRYRIAKARKNGMTVRWGLEADIPLFFELMKGSCQRQGTAPNPTNAQTLSQLWRTFSSEGKAHLLIAEFCGAPTAAVLCLSFGRTVTLWKKGWDSLHAEFHPNDLLYDEVLQWAHRSAFHELDHCAMNPAVAQKLISGNSDHAFSTPARDTFILRMGGRPKLLPKPQLLISNRILRLLFRTFHPTGRATIARTLST